jgi:cell division protein FtsI/penicillin-binding protein 2
MKLGLTPVIVLLQQETSVENVTGNSVVLTIDADLQAVVESKLEEVILQTQEE